MLASFHFSCNFCLLLWILSFSSIWLSIKAQSDPRELRNPREQIDPRELREREVVPRSPYVERSYSTRANFPNPPPNVHVQPHSQPPPPTPPHPRNIPVMNATRVTYTDSREYDRRPETGGEYPMYPMNPLPRNPAYPEYVHHSPAGPRPRPRNPPLPPLIPEPPAGSLVAYVHGNGLVGYFMFTPSQTRQTTITYHLAGGSHGDTLQWKIYSNPNQPNNFQCTPAIIGSMVHDLKSMYGDLVINQRTVLETDFNLKDEDSIYGRSMVIESLQTGVRTCSTILPANKKTMYVAKFHSPIAGSVQIMESNGMAGVLVEYMMYSDGKRKETTHSWALFGVTGEEASIDSQVENEINRCSKLQGVAMLPTSTQQAKVLTVSTERPTLKGRSYQVVKGLRPLSSMDAVYMVVYEHKKSQKILACAPLREIRPKSATAKFSGQDIKGTMDFQQETPYDPTKVKMDLNIVTSAYSFGIDTLPTIKRRKSETRKCPNVKETIYNPLQRDPEEVPPQAFGTTDQYAVGDLSGKYGPLDNPKNHKLDTMDFNLPLFGMFSVIGRAVVMYSPDGPALTCANIDLQEANISTTYATFDAPLQGQFIFRQDAENCFDDMYIYIEVSKPDGSNIQKSFNHMWHVHEKPVESDSDTLSSTKCAQAGPHLNPYNVSTACIYQRDCTMFTPERCEVGDQTGKLTPLDIPPYKVIADGEPDVAKYYLIDTDLSNCGPNSIIGRSVVIHEEDYGGPRLTCSNILEFKPRSAA